MTSMRVLRRDQEERFWFVVAVVVLGGVVVPVVAFGLWMLATGWMIALGVHNIHQIMWSWLRPPSHHGVYGRTNHRLIIIWAMSWGTLFILYLVGEFVGSLFRSYKKALS